MYPTFETKEMPKLPFLSGVGRDRCSRGLLVSGHARANAAQPPMAGDRCGHQPEFPGRAHLHARCATQPAQPAAGENRHRVARIYA